MGARRLRGLDHILFGSLKRCAVCWILTLWLATTLLYVWRFRPSLESLDVHGGVAGTSDVLTDSFLAHSKLDSAHTHPATSALPTQLFVQWPPLEWLDPHDEGPEDGAMASHLVDCGTTKGNMTIAIFQNWAPHGVTRFLELVEDGFFSTMVALFRVSPNFITQFGISGDPTVTRKWRQKGTIPDDPHWQKRGFNRGWLSFAGSGSNSRTTQLFVAMGDSGLGEALHEVPLGRVVQGMESVDRWYPGYGELQVFGGRAPDQGRLEREGLSYTKREYPDLDYITSCRIVWRASEKPGDVEVAARSARQRQCQGSAERFVVAATSSFGSEWRLVATAGGPTEEAGCPYCWDVAEVKFIVADGSGGARMNGFMSSGAVGIKGFEVDRAFDKSKSSVWGGRPDTSGSTWLGAKFDRPVSLCAVELHQSGSNFATKVSLEVRSDDGAWQGVASLQVAHQRF
eukprot:TRINITY_DN19182_c0_g1_i1.p1 TRINITY_DN19182_c0_g1~~TRINITY_DN19182_c0_g1_i1.p1  ORF type:complete len:477 (+),score=47.38 TRINITY_DN19182_c0_g1_i1:64-1431(+)